PTPLGIRLPTDFCLAISRAFLDNIARKRLGEPTGASNAGGPMRLIQFRVQNYRTIQSTEWIDVSSLTAFVGQNEAGKSNLCEALYILNPIKGENYNVHEDWPLDDWSGRNEEALVCEARFRTESREET